MSMQEYKVICENNRPVTAKLLNYVNYRELIKLTRQENKKYINWLVVVGESEKDAIESADYILANFWAKYLTPDLS